MAANNEADELTREKTRAEQAETRAEQAETRTEQAETRAEQAETRTEQAESALQQMIYPESDRLALSHNRFLINGSENGIAGRKHLLQKLTARQREILQMLVEGQNTKQIAFALKLSPKTVEYHRAKLMAELELQSLPGLVRFAVNVGLITPEN